MRKILITGSSGYVGSNFESWLKTWPSNYSVKSVSVRNDDWMDLNFKEFDVILHFAGIVHSSKEKPEEYYKINSELTEKIAKKAIAEGVKQFVFMSSMSVYGKNTKLIDRDTKLSPDTHYGKSKMEAENKILKLQNIDQNFIVSIIRPPMIYGKKSPGNYKKLADLALKLNFFPYVMNERSMIYIENLNVYLKYLIDNTIGGIHTPQNYNYVNTATLVKEIAKNNNHKIILIPIPILFKKLILKLPLLNKIYGDLKYSFEISNIFNLENEFIDFKESIKRTEEKK